LHAQIAESLRAPSESRRSAHTHGSIGADSSKQR